LVGFPSGRPAGRNDADRDPLPTDFNMGVHNQQELSRKALSDRGQLAGTALVVERGDGTFDTLLGRLRSALAPRMRAIVTITVTKALPLTSPVYDDGKTEPELRRAWTRFRKLQPNERFEE
jgi:hypothetical protein